MILNFLVLIFDYLSKINVFTRNLGNFKIRFLLLIIEIFVLKFILI
jgi:hypothetical protein